jgi:hypothetical protein
MDVCIKLMVMDKKSPHIRKPVKQKKTLQSVSPDFIADNFNVLKNILTSLNLLKN